MGEITAITAQQKNKKRVNIFIDGEYNCSLDKMAAFSNGLRVGITIEPERLNEIIVASETQGAFDAGIKYLIIRRRARQEVEEYLKKKEYHEQAIIQAIEKLIEYGYINDEEFANIYIRSYRNKFGNKKLKYDLTRLGVEGEIIEKYLSVDGTDELEACMKTAEKYIKTHKNKANYQKLVAYLYSKGFSGDNAKRVASKLDLNAQHLD